MRLRIVPPPVRPTAYPEPSGCPYPDCASRHVQCRQAVPKPVRELHINAVIAHRDQCPRCGRTVRGYPTGISHDQTSAHRKGLAGMFDARGMSSGAGAIALSALGCPLSKVAGYHAVQAAGAAGPGRREAVRQGGGCLRAVGVDLPSVRCLGQWRTVGVRVDAVSGVVRTIDGLPAAETATLTAWVGDLAAAMGAEVLVSAAAAAGLQAADAHGWLPQLGNTHVVRNTERLVGELSAATRSTFSNLGTLAGSGGDFGRARSSEASTRLTTRRLRVPDEREERSMYIVSPSWMREAVSSRRLNPG